MCFLAECLTRRLDNLQQFNISYNMYCIRTRNQKRREEEEERRRDRRTNEDYDHGGGIRESGAPPSNLILPTADERSRRSRLKTSGARIVVSDISGVEVARLGTARVRIATPCLAAVFQRRQAAAQLERVLMYAVFLPLPVISHITQVELLEFMLLIILFMPAQLSR